MKQKFYLTYALLIGVALASCKTASKMYEKGNYDEAVELAARKLQKDPDDPKLLDIITQSYRFAVNDHETRVRNHHNTQSELKWESIYTEYASLQKMYDAIYRVPSVFQLIGPADYSSFLVTYAEKAGDARYTRGMDLMERGDKTSFRQAYREFQAANRFKPGDRDVQNRMAEAWDLAATNVVVQPMQQSGGFVHSGYAVGGNNLDDRLIRSLQHSSGNEFVRFYGAWDARSRQVRPDFFLDMQLASLDIGRTRDFNSTRRVSKEVVVKETVYRPDSIVREYGKVFAEITTTRRTIHSDALLQVQVRDADGRYVWGEPFSSHHSWSTEFARFTGDTRALSENEKELVNRPRVQPPGENEIVQCLLDEISHNALYRVRGYFNRY